MTILFLTIVKFIKNIKSNYKYFKIIIFLYQLFTKNNKYIYIRKLNYTSRT